MMDKKRLSEQVQYVEGILAEKKLPSLETIMDLSRNVYEGAYINTEIVFMEEDVNPLIVRFDSTSILPLAEEVIEAGKIIENPNFIGRLNKYCHMTNNEISLFATRMDMYNDTYAVIGIGQVKENSQWVARLKLEGHLKWTLQLSDDQKTIHYDGLFTERICHHSKIEIPEEFDSESTKTITEIVSFAKEQKHGTMLVVLDREEAEKEANRLCVQFYRGIRVNSFKLRDYLDDIIVPITSIDGAILIDNDGICYGIGVILDGEATKPANSARGARFNSACVYVNNKKKNKKRCLCVVISEDGMINSICTKNIDIINPEQINYNELREINFLYNRWVAREDAMIEIEEAKHRLLYGDPDCF